MRSGRAQLIYCWLAVALGVSAALSPVAAGASRLLTQCLCCTAAQPASEHATVGDDRPDCCEKHGTSQDAPASSESSQPEHECQNCACCILLSGGAISGVLLTGVSASVATACGAILLDRDLFVAAGAPSPLQRPPATC